MSLQPPPLPAPHLVVTQEVLLNYELSGALPICLCSLRAATGTVNHKNCWFEAANSSPVRVNMSSWIQGMQLHSCVQWEGLMFILETGKNHKKRTDFKEIALIFGLWKGEQHSSSAAHFRDPKPSTLFCTVREIKRAVFFPLYWRTECYSPPLNRIEREIKSSYAFSFKIWAGHVEMASAVIYMHQSYLRGSMNNTCHEEIVAHPPLSSLLIPWAERFCHQPL